MTELEYLRFISFVLSLNFVYTCYKDLRTHIKELVRKRW